MLREKIQAARPGDLCARFVVACALVAVKSVLGARIDVNLDVTPLGADGLHIGKRDTGVLLAEMQLCRHLRLVVGKAHDRPAVIADRSLQAGKLRRGRIRNTAAETEA